MTVVDTAPPAARWRWGSVVVVAVPAVYVVALALFLVLPWWVNDLYRFPLIEVSGGAHDPKYLWPYADGGIVASVWGHGTMLTLVFGWISIGFSVKAAVDLSDRGLTRTQRVAAAVSVALTVGTLVWWVLMGGHLLGWWVD